MAKEIIKSAWQPTEKWEVKAIKKQSAIDKGATAGTHSADDFDYEKVKQIGKAANHAPETVELINSQSHYTGIRLYAPEETAPEETA